MSSNKASFEAQDPSHGAEKAEGIIPTRKSEDDASISKGEPAAQQTKLSDIDFATGKPLDAEVSERPSFYKRDPDLGEASFTPREEGKYTGAERRSGDSRRSGGERRDDVRFDLDKKDRRQNNGRRKDDLSPDYW